MALKFLQETHQMTLGKIKSDLSYLDPSIDLDVYEGLSTLAIGRKLTEMRDTLTEQRSGTYGSWLRDESYTCTSMIVEALETMIAEKKDQMATERLVPGATYYTGVSRFGNILEGRQAIFLGSKFTGWMNLNENTAIAKARQVLRHGSEEDFRQIYVGMADGRVDALNAANLSHLSESSDDALSLIEAYCDSRWEGPWPWEIEAPEKLKVLIESREEKNMKQITELQRGFARLLREMDEGNLNQYEMVSAAQDMMSKVDSIIVDLGKLSATGIEVTAQAQASGDESLVAPMQSALGEPLNAAVGALTNLKAALTTATSDLTGAGSAAPADPMDDGGMGSPADAMGAPMGGDTDAVDAIGDVDIAGDEEERPIKEL